MNDVQGASIGGMKPVSAPKIQKHELDEVMEDETEAYEGENINGLINQGKTRNRSGADAGGSAAIPLYDAATAEKSSQKPQGASNQQYDRFGNKMTHSKQTIAGWKNQKARESI